MKIITQNILEDKPRWFTSALLFILLYLMYSSTFLSDYLMNDERGLIGREKGEIVSAISSYYFRYGRGLFGLYEKLVYDFVGYNTVRIQFIRFLNFFSLALIAVLLLKFLEGRIKNRHFAFFTILFLFSQLSIQGLMGYSLQLFSNSHPSMWLSLLAFYLFFFTFEGSRVPRFVQVGIVFVILALAMQSTQTYAFFSVIPVAYLALTNWKKMKTRVIQFLLIAIAVFVFSAIAYRVSLEFLPEVESQAYKRGEVGLNALYESPLQVFLLGINPRTYWSVFKFWTFPYPLQNIPPLLNIIEKVFSLVLMIIWAGIVLGAFYIELKNDGRDGAREVIAKWLTVLFYFGLGAVFLIADSPLTIIDHRPHILLTLSGLVIFTGAYALEILESKLSFLKMTSVRALMSLAVLMTAFGAQSGVLRNIVNIHARQIDFIRSELLEKDPSSYNTVIIILPKWNDCITEPCGPWFGSNTDANWHLQRPGAYRYVLATLGADPEKKITYVFYGLSTALPPDAVVVDWNKYAKAQQDYASFLKSKWLESKLAFLLDK